MRRVFTRTRDLRRDRASFQYGVRQAEAGARMSAADSAPSRLLTMRNLIAKPNILLIASALLALTFPVACNRKQAPQSPGVSDLDPLNRADSTRIEPRHFLHKTFPVKKHAEFVIEVPPHAAIPHLEGSFRSFISQPG